MRDLPRYRRDSQQGRCLGWFPVLELLRRHPGRVRRIVHTGRVPPERLELLERECRRSGVELHRDDGLVRKLSHRSDVETFALFDKYLEELVADTDHLVLVAPRNPGNLGAALRSTAAFGCFDLALVGEAVDDFSPHVIRASIGARFAVRVERFPDLETYLSRYDREINLFTRDAASTLYDSRFARPCSLVFGPEWPGLGERELRLGRPLSIPQGDAAESLNLAAAVSVGLYELGRQRRS